MDYTRFLLEDFVMHPYFQQWVLEPDEESARFWSAWLQNHPSKEAIIWEAREIVMQLNENQHVPSESDKQSMWRLIERARVEYDKERAGHESKALKTDGARTFARRAMLLVIGSIAFFVVACIIIYARTGPGDVTYYSGNAKAKIVVLPDKSTAILNKNTTLRLSPDWGPGKWREVWLAGEAYFSVVPLKDDEKFIVHTSTVQLEVLGTKFNVTESENETSIVLHSGKLKLTGIKRDGDSLERIMMPGDMVDIDANGVIMENDTADATVQPAWKKPYLIFEETPIREIIRRLEAEYDVTVKMNISDASLLNRKFTARYPAEDVNILLQALSKSFGISVTQEGDQIIFQAE